MTTDRRTIRVEIHPLQPVRPRTWVLEPVLDGARFALTSTPLYDCRACLPKPRRGLPLCRTCRTLHCLGCGEEALALLAVDHTHGGALLCAGCVFAWTITGRCEHAGRCEDSAAWARAFVPAPLLAESSNEVRST